MPYLDSALRSALGLVGSVHDEAAIAAACAARGLVLSGGQLQPAPAKPARKASPRPLETA